MSEQMTEKVKGLPENAYTELKPGEETERGYTIFSNHRAADGSSLFCCGCLPGTKNRAGF